MIADGHPEFGVGHKFWKIYGKTGAPVRGRARPPSLRPREIPPASGTGAPRELSGPTESYQCCFGGCSKKSHGRLRQRHFDVVIRVRLRDETSMELALCLSIFGRARVFNSRGGGQRAFLEMLSEWRNTHAHLEAILPFRDRRRSTRQSVHWDACNRHTKSLGST